jgi:DNA-binding GntR family transcriptional regulator
MAVATPPLYVRIQELLRTQIASGRIAAGERLPSETELAERFSTTRMTVRQALAQLTFEGLIQRRVGLGTFVAEGPVESRIDAQRVPSFEEQMEETGVRVGFRLLGFDHEAASPAVAATLGLDADAPIYRLRRLRLVRGEVIGLEDRSMPERIGSAIPAGALLSRPATRIVEAVLGTPLGGMTVSVGALVASAQLARDLEVKRGSAVLVRSHTFYDQDGHPVLTGDSTYRGDKYRFTYRYGRVPDAKGERHA